MGSQLQPLGGSCSIRQRRRYPAGQNRAHDIRSRRRRVTTGDPSRMVGGTCTTPMLHRYLRPHIVCRGKMMADTGMPDITVYSTPHSMIPCNSADLHQTLRRLRS